MSGAYTAKVAVVSIPSRPPGWPITWPYPGDTGYDPDPFFPAPFPPGYTPDYSFTVSGTESIAYDGAASITGTFRDHTSYATNEPDVIVWTATVSSSPTRNVKLRFSGDEDYADSISSVCIFGTYWGATPDIEFELTDEDAGGTIILTAKSAISGSYLGATLAIEVSSSALVRILLTVSASVAVAGDGYYNRSLVYSDSGNYGIAILQWSDVMPPFDYNYSETEAGGVTCSRTEPVGGNGVTTIDMSEATDGVDTSVGLDIYVSEATVTFTATLKVYVDGDLDSTTQKVLALSGEDEYDDTWCTVDGDTGEVTV